MGHRVQSGLPPRVPHPGTEQNQTKPRSHPSASTHTYIHTHKYTQVLPPNQAQINHHQSLLDVQQRLHGLPADGALVGLVAQRVSARLADAHVAAGQDGCVARCTHANDTLTPIHVLCGRAACCASGLHAIDFLQLVTDAVNPDLLLQHLQGPLVVVVLFELGICALRLYPLWESITHWHLQQQRRTAA